jgi:mono/diheme cytochrome c family protein
MAATTNCVPGMARSAPPATTPFAPDLTGPIISAATPPRPLSGGTLLVLPGGDTAAASDPDRDVVYIVDLKARRVRATVSLQPGDEPGRLVADAAGDIHVALRRGGAVATFDPITGQVKARESVCAAPRGLAYAPSKDLVHVACADGLLVSLHAAGGVFRVLTLERDLRDVVATKAGALLVSTFRHADALVIDEGGNVTQTLRPPARSGLSSTKVPRSLSPAVAWRMVPFGDDRALMLHQRGVDDVVDPSPGGYAGSKGCGGIVESATTLVSSEGAVDTSPSLASVTLGVDVAVSPDRLSVVIASAGNAHTPLPQLLVASLSTVLPSTVPPPGDGCVFMNPVVGPPPMVVEVGGLPDQPPGQVVAVAYQPDGIIVSLSREPAALWTSDGKGAISLSAESTADSGHLLFHVNAGGGIACASCHPEGGEDGRVWNFACLGARRTQSLRGGLSGTEPFHWDGDMADFPRLVQAVFVGRMSGPMLSQAQSAALLRWLDGVPELPVPAPTNVSAVDRGRRLFASAAVGCGACHAGPLFTNNLTVDVGTGGKLQVPSLRGVGWRAPYLHNGCASRLADRFGTCGGGDKHGHTSQLQPSDVSDLTAFLQTL